MTVTTDRISFKSAGAVRKLRPIVFGCTKCGKTDLSQSEADTLENTCRDPECKLKM